MSLLLGNNLFHITHTHLDLGLYNIVHRRSFSTEHGNAIVMVSPILLYQLLVM